MKKLCALVLTGLLLSPAAQADIVIGAVAAYTGQDAASGEQIQRGVEAAVAAINEKGGVLGQKLKVEYKDDACDPRQAVSVANQLVSSGVKFVVGHMCSGASIPASKVYAEEGVVMVSPSSTNPKLTDQGLKSIFRVCGRDDQQGQVVAGYIMKKFPGKKVAIVHDKTAYGQGVADEVKKNLNAGGVKETVYENITKGERDFAPLLSKLKNAGVEILYYGGNFTEAGLIARQMKGVGLHAKLILPDDSTTAAFWTIAGDAGEGTLISFPPDPRYNDVAADAVKRIRAKGYEPESYTLYAYAAVQVIADAITKAGKQDVGEITKNIHADTYDTVLGKIAFDDKGDVKAPGFVMYQWTKGNYEMLKEDAPVATP